MQRHHPNRSSSRVAASRLLFTIVIVLPYLMFSRCSADEPSRDIFGHRATTMTANDHEAAVSSALGMHSKGNGEKKFARFSSSASAERYATVLRELTHRKRSPKSAKAAAAGAKASKSKSAKSASPSLAPSTSFAPSESSQPSQEPSKSSEPSTSVSPTKSGKSSKSAKAAKSAKATISAKAAKARY